MAYPTGGAGWPPPGPPGPAQWPPPGPTGPGYWPPGPPGAQLSIEAAKRNHRWFLVYVAAFVLLYLGMVAFGLLLLLYPFSGTAAEVEELRTNGGVFVVIGAAFLVVYAVGLFLPRRQWGWVYGVVLIGLGMSSCLTLPATIPLLIAWLKPEMKARFQMS